MNEQFEGCIAIVGMAGRLPNATSLQDFWASLLKGDSLIRSLSADELRAAGVLDALIDDPAYVRVAADIDQLDQFDPAFFGMGQREASLIDPQQRILLELSYEAFEDAGYVPDRLDGRVGVYLGSGYCGYLMAHLAREIDGTDQLGGLQILMGNDKDYAPTRVSYKLGLTGPSLSVNTACSTALVAVHQACRALQSWECDFALAGAVKINLPGQVGYLHQEGGISSRDGTCRPYDAEGSGPVFGSGAGVVLLKRLASAVEDRDHIYAVIRGSAVNNDGSAKMSFSAPSAEGQIAVIVDALADAGVKATDIGYVEGHGTSTPLGDPIEVSALTEVFRADGVANGRCLLGAVKANVGHLEAAAGMAGLFKTVFALREDRIPPLLNFRAANLEIPLAGSPFRINTEVASFPPGARRVAGLSAFGIGGTNAHMVLEAWTNEPADGPPATGPFLLPLSADTPAALATLRQHYAKLLNAPDTSAAHVTQTAAIGRRHRRCRAIVVGNDAHELATRLEDGRELAGAESGLEIVFSDAPWSGKDIGAIGHMVGPGLRRRLRDIDALLVAAGMVPDASKPIWQRWAQARLQLAFAHWIQGARLPAMRTWSDEPSLAAACLALGVITLKQAVEATWVRLDLKPAHALKSKNLSLLSHGGVHRLDGTGTWERLASPACWLPSAANDASAGHVIRRLPDSTAARLHIGALSGTADPVAVADSLLQTVARAYASGADLDWSSIHADAKLRKVSLPTYPFQRVRCWVDAAPAHSEARAAGVAQDASASTMPIAEAALAIVAGFAKVSVDSLTPATRFQHELGMESVMLAELNAALTRRLALSSRPPLKLYFGEGRVGDLLAWLEAHQPSTAQVAAGPGARNDDILGGELGERLREWHATSTFPEPQRLERRWVHKAREENVLVARVGHVDGDRFIAEITQDPQHAYYYEHAQDHVPGLYLLEAARQAATAITHQHYGVPLGFKFILNDMSSNFDRMAELDAPILIVIQLDGVQRREGVLERASARTTFIQKSTVLGYMQSTAVVFTPDDYMVLRDGAAIIAA